MLEQGTVEGAWKAAAIRMVEPWSEPIVLRNLLCAVDFSECSYQALRYAAEIARHFGSQLYIQHILSLPPEASWHEDPSGWTKERVRGARRIAEHGLRRLHAEADLSGLNVTFLLTDGVPGSRILETVGERKIDLLVIGTHARRGIKRLVEGSLAERLVHEAICPVLVAAPPRESMPALPEPGALAFQTILMATDFSRSADRALTYALRWAAEWGGRVLLLHAVEPVSAAPQSLASLFPESDASLEAHIRSAWEKMRVLVPDPALARCRIDYEVRSGNAAEQILDCAQERKADLIVLGARGVGRASLTWGSTLSQVVRAGRFPVMALRHLGL
ncbi:MAG TPA: universal stress protein [Terriglobia bacterium]|nr:universal stress protein [Terriglobia bacterium]